MQTQIQTLILAFTSIQEQLIHAQLEQLGMKDQDNAYTAHFQTSLFKEMLKTDGNAIATPHSSCQQTMMGQKHVNDQPFIDVLLKFLD